MAGPDTKLARVYERWLQNPRAWEFPHAKLRAARVAAPPARRLTVERPDGHGIHPCAGCMGGERFRGWVRHRGVYHQTKIEDTRVDAYEALWRLMRELGAETPVEVEESAA